MKRLLPEDRQTDPSNKSPLITHSPTRRLPHFIRFFVLPLLSLLCTYSTSHRRASAPGIHHPAIEPRARAFRSSWDPSLFPTRQSETAQQGPRSHALHFPFQLQRPCWTLQSTTSYPGRRIGSDTRATVLPERKGGKVTGHGGIVVVVVSPVLLPWSLGSGSRKSMLSPTPAPTPVFFLGTFSFS